MVRCWRAPVLGVVLLTLMACSRHERNAATPEPSKPPATAGESTPGNTESGESGLSIKRGLVTVHGDHALFTSCGDKTPLWLIDESDGALARLITDGATSAYVEAYGERAPAPEDIIPAARDQAGVFILEQLLYAGGVGETGGCEQPEPDYVVSARGNEPFWSVQVTADAAIWRQPQDPQEIQLGHLESQDAEGTVSYRASSAQHKLELYIDAQSCSDSMSGEFFAFAARGTLDGKPFKGCARVGTLAAQ